MNRVRTVPIPPSEEILKQCVVDPTLKSDSAYSHLANMICMYDPEKNKFDLTKSIKKRSNHTKVVVNHYGLNRAYTDSLKFLGVTRDHLSDGGTSGFTVCVDGIVSILQPAEFISNYDYFQLGNYVALSSRKSVRKLSKSFTETRLLVGMSAETAREPRNAPRIIGRIVERRSLHGDVLRVKLLPFGLRIPDDSEVVTPGTPTSVAPSGGSTAAITTADLNPSVGDSDGSSNFTTLVQFPYGDDTEVYESESGAEEELHTFDIRDDLKETGRKIEDATKGIIGLYDDVISKSKNREDTLKELTTLVTPIKGLVKELSKMTNMTDDENNYRAHLLDHEMYIETIAKWMQLTDAEIERYNPVTNLDEIYPPPKFVQNRGKVKPTNADNSLEVERKRRRFNPFNLGRKKKK